jgi:hypothetical protein
LNWAYALLGISDDSDTATIKRAYARLLRTTRPDEDAAAFQRLNAAYQTALAQATQRQAASPPPPQSVPTVVVSLAPAPHTDPAPTHPDLPATPRQHLRRIPSKHCGPAKKPRHRCRRHR